MNLRGKDIYDVDEGLDMDYNARDQPLKKGVLIMRVNFKFGAFSSTL